NVHLGEFELLLSCTGYNDITKMQEHIQNASALLKQTAKFIDTNEGWTFGSPSVLYMFYRESGELETEVRNLKDALPLYSQITNGHGKGGEHLMEAEGYYNRGDLENAEIIVHKAFYEANRCNQYDIIIGTLFLQARIALFKGDYVHILAFDQKMHEEMLQSKQYNLLHNIDLCDAFINAELKRNQTTSRWIENGDFESSRLFFPAMAFMNIVYGKVLLINKEYYKLLGIAEQFLGVASVFPNLLGLIYTNIYIASANEQIFRHEDAMSALKCALDIAISDKVYMPFVENGDYINSLLEELGRQGLYRNDITKILALNESYRKAITLINSKLSAKIRPALAEREIQIALLASEGFSNKEIGEKLFISQNTVKTMLKRVFEKLDLNSRAMLKQHFDEKL
ncbi:MAG: helix-turn-helix domain-containing protein, partial [Mobilitalea sp.]